MNQETYTAMNEYFSQYPWVKMEKEVSDDPETYHWYLISCQWSWNYSIQHLLKLTTAYLPVPLLRDIPGSPFIIGVHDLGWATEKEFYGQ